MERRLLIVLVGLFLMIDLIAILFVYNHNFVGEDNNKRPSSITSSGSTSFAHSSLNSYSKSSPSSYNSPYEGEYVNFGKKSCDCGN